MLTLLQTAGLDDARMDVKIIAYSSDVAVLKSAFSSAVTRLRSDS